MLFKDIFSQDKAVGLLQKAFATGRWSHACIFAGPDGVGKTLTAMAWARLLLCAQPDTSGSHAEGCGRCASCKAIQAGSHPDLHLVYKELKQFTEDGKGKAPPVDLGIDVVREFLIEKVALRPGMSGRRIFVVQEAEKLSLPAQNALLKVLEEPPSFCGIVLICARLDKLLATIRSRSQVVSFGPVDERIITEDLKGRGMAPDKARYLARLAQGSWGMACALAGLDQAGADLYSAKKVLVQRVAEARVEDALDLAQACVDQGKHLAEVWQDLEPGTSKTDLTRRAQKVVIRIITSVWADAMRSPFVEPSGLVNADQAEVVARLAGHLGPEEAGARVSDGFEALVWVEASVNERLVFERLLLKGAGSGIIAVSRQAGPPAR